MENSFFIQLLEQAGIAYVHYRHIKDEAGNIVDAEFVEMNKVAESVLGGIPAAYLLGQRISQFMDGAFMKARGKELLSTEYLSFEHHSRSTAKWFKTQAITIVDGYRTTVFLDITKDKETELAIQASVERVNIQREAIAGLLLQDAIVSGDMAAAAPYITELLADTLQTSRASLWLFSPDKSELRCVSLFELAERRHSEGTMLYKKDFPRYFDTMCTDARISAEDAHTDPGTSEFSEIYLKPLGISSMLDAAIMIHGEVVGVICLEYIGEKRKWTVDEESFASTAAAVFSQTIVSAERKKTEQELLQSKLQLEDLEKQQALEQELRQQQEKLLLEISTPITQLWSNILLLPLVGGMNTKRAQDILAATLRKVVDTQAKVFIMDISGVTIVDTAVANGFIKLSKATRLMGCDCIISGISPSIAQTMVELGIQIDEVMTTGTMQDAMTRALNLTGLKIMEME